MPYPRLRARGHSPGYEPEAIAQAACQRPWPRLRAKGHGPGCVPKVIAQDVCQGPSPRLGARGHRPIAQVTCQSSTRHPVSDVVSFVHCATPRRAVPRMRAPIRARGLLCARRRGRMRDCVCACRQQLSLERVVLEWNWPGHHEALATGLHPRHVRARQAARPAYPCVRAWVRAPPRPPPLAYRPAWFAS